jgi:hypothetical protein
MNRYETKWMNVEFPDPWRIQTTRDKIIFTPLSVTSKNSCELFLLKKAQGDATDDDLEQYAASFLAQSKPTKLTLGCLDGFSLVTEGGERRVYLRSGHFILFSIIRSEEAEFESQALSVIESIELEKDYRDRDAP